MENSSPNMHRASGSIPAQMQEQRGGWPMCWPSSGLSPGKVCRRHGPDVA
ncbi:MAG TPA: hypothetical protein VF844_19090 [Ktedonobacteraceae bacterium]